MFFPSLATELIVHGLLKISPAVPVKLSSDSTLILWVLDQPALLAHIGKHWVRMSMTISIIEWSYYNRINITFCSSKRFNVQHLFSTISASIKACAWDK